MKIGDLVKLKKSVLHHEEFMDPVGVITAKHMEAVKVHWFSQGLSKPNSSQFVLKLVVISSL
jgi:hypothetical protein